MNRTASLPRGLTSIALGSFALAFGVRLLWIFTVQSPFDSVYSDMQGYVDRAERLLWHMPVDDPRVLTFFPPGTHALLALEFLVFGRHADVAIRIAHALVGAIPAACVPLLTYRLVPRRWVAALVGVAVAFWQPQIWCVGFFTSEIWFSAAIAAHAWLTVRAPWRAPGLLGTGAAAITAIVVRPQFLLTWVLDAGARLALLVWRRGPRRAFRTAFWLTLPVVLGLTFTSLRYHSLSGGRWGLISVSGLNRIWADTDVCKVEASWTLPDGGFQSWWFSPPSKPALKPSDTVTFEGFIVDPDILEKIRRERTRGVPLSDQIARHVDNVELLLLKNLPWPESNYKDPVAWLGGLTRERLEELFRDVVLYAVLPWCFVGIVLARNNSTKRILTANLFTLVFAAAFFFGEARYHCTYDPFAIVLGVAGMHEAFVRIRRRILRWRRRARGVGSPRSSRDLVATRGGRRLAIYVLVAVATAALIGLPGAAGYELWAHRTPTKSAPSTPPSTASERSEAPVWHHGKTTAEVRALLGADKRLVSIAVASAYPLRLDVAMVDNSGAGKVSWWWVPETGPDVTAEDVGRFAGSHDARVVSLAPYVVEGGTYFAAIYIAAGGSDDHGWWFYFDQPRSSLDELLSRLDGRFVDLRSYVRGTTLYSAVIVPKVAKSEGWWWYTGIDAASVREKLIANGAVLTSLEPAEPDRSTFDVVMTSTPWRSTPTFDDVHWSWAAQEGD